VGESAAVQQRMIAPTPTPAPETEKGLSHLEVTLKREGSVTVKVARVAMFARGRKGRVIELRKGRV
jgi:hypothetical protein